MDVGELKLAILNMPDSWPVRFFDRTYGGTYWPSFAIEEVDGHVDSDGVTVCRLLSFTDKRPREQ